MRLVVNKLEFFKAVDDLSKYKIDTATFGRRIGDPTRAKTDITYKRIGRVLLNEYLGINIREYRCRGFKLSLMLETPIQPITIEPLKIDVNEVYRLLKKIDLPFSKHLFQRYALWTFIDIYDTRQYVLHLLYHDLRAPEFFRLQLGENYATLYPVDDNKEKRIKRFLEWLSFYS